ncbi:MAG: L-lactate dehydrogenase [Clostridia bacterium]|nr:L-lactate dehydrogenase [Clostridia bacterium]
MSKITVIGAGSVGATIAYTLTISGMASEIVLIDIDQSKSRGQALDIRQGLPFFSACSIYAGTYADAAGSDIVIISSGVARKEGQTRLDLAQTNVNILKSICQDVTRYATDAVYIIVSNPVDVLTYAFCKYSGMPGSRIIGSGTILDTARLRARISEYYAINQNNVHAYVLGEHGDSSFIPWSLASIANVNVLDYRNMVQNADNYPEFRIEDVEQYVRESGSRIIRRKGATFYAVSMSVCHLCKCLQGKMNAPLTVSTMMNGEYGINDVCLSLLTLVGQNGVHNKIMLPLTDTELKQLHHSADCLKDVIRQIEL